MNSLFPKIRPLLFGLLIGVGLYGQMGQASGEQLTDAKTNAALGALSASVEGMRSRKVAGCLSKPEMFAELSGRAPESIPEGRLLVANELNTWIESADPRGLKIWVRHNFKTGVKEFVCANLPQNIQENFSIPILVLFDQSKEKKTGDSVWQLQIMVRDHELGLWNQKSRLLSSAMLLGPDAKSSWFNVFVGTKLFLNERSSGAYKIKSLIEFDPSL